MPQERLRIKMQKKRTKQKNYTNKKSDLNNKEEDFSHMSDTIVPEKCTCSCGNTHVRDISRYIPGVKIYPRHLARSRFNGDFLITIDNEIVANVADLLSARLMACAFQMRHLLIQILLEVKNNDMQRPRGFPVMVAISSKMYDEIKWTLHLTRNATEETALQPHNLDSEEDDDE